MKVQFRNFEIQKFIISWELRITQRQFFSDVGRDFLVSPYAHEPLR